MVRRTWGPADFAADVRAALSRTLEGPSAPRPQAPDGTRDDGFGQVRNGAGTWTRCT